MADGGDFFGLFNNPNAPAETMAPGLALAANAASGAAPSAASYQQQAGLQQAQRAATARSNSTRGNFGLASASKTGQGVGQDMSQQAITTAAQQRAQEQAQARQQYLQGLTQQADVSAQYNLANQQEANKLFQGGVGAVSSLAMLSDAREKNVTQDGPSMARAFLDSLSPASFSYKDPGAAPNPGAASHENLGVLAQDVEKSPAGPAIVQEDGQGKKQLDIHSLVGALAAGMGETHRRQQEHDQRLSALERVVGRG